MFCFHKVPFLQPLLSFFFSEKERRDDVEESSLSKEFSEEIFMDKYCVWCYNSGYLFILCFSSTFNPFEANDDRCRVLRF